jgi:hypothetical protein
MRIHRAPDLGAWGLDAALERREPVPRWQAWIETVALALAALALGALVDAGDPFLLRHAFPWLALPPMLAGLRYGSAHGVSCSALQGVALAIAWALGRAPAPHVIPELALGWALAGLVPGKFRDAWRRRARLLETSGDALRIRVESLARAHHALKISHDRLQRELPGSASSLRDALDRLRREMLEGRDGEPVEALGGRVLAFLCEHAPVRAATLHVVAPGQRPGPAVAALGPATPVADDPLVARASRLGHVVSVRDLPEGSGVLAAVPLVDVEGRVAAVVAVHDMPFASLHADTLTLLATLGGQLGDLLSHALPPARATNPRPRGVRRLQRTPAVAAATFPMGRDGLGA